MNRRISAIFAMKGVLLGALLTVGSTSFGYYTTMDNGEIIKKGQYRIVAEPNVVFNDLQGLNMVAKFDMGFNESSNFRGVLGAGAVGFQTGLLYKWIPIPDFEDQPAIGLLGGFIYARNAGISYLNLRLHPLVSKKFETENGIVIPYVAFPFGVTTSEGKATYPLQLTVGSEWQPTSFKNISFMGEVGIDLHESYSYIAVAGLLRFDEEQGLKFE